MVMAGILASGLNGTGGGSGGKDRYDFTNSDNLPPREAGPVAPVVVVSGIAAALYYLPVFGATLARSIALRFAPPAILAGAKILQSVNQSIQQGLLKPGGLLVRVLNGIQEGYVAAAPKSAMEALSVVQNATKVLNLEPGIATLQTNGGIILSNVGGIITTISAGGAILVQRGTDILLHIVP
jgi:hypothetical protein